MQKLQNIKRIAIIGGGPAGVATAKYLLAENTFSKIDIYEQRSTCAGVWNYTSENDREAQFHVPQTEPYTEPEQPIWRHEGGTGSKKHATFISPLYERLEANLPKMIMQHYKTPFPEDSQLLPTHEAITEYLERYADEVRHLIQFETQTISIKPLPDQSSKGWSVSSKNLRTGASNTSNYDAVAIASGHFNEPFIPPIKGIVEWHRKYPNSITHSKFFRRPEDFRNKKILVIGVRSSGSDIANQTEPYCTSPILVSSRAPISSLPKDTPTRTHLPALSEFLPSTRSIRFADGSLIPDIDTVIFCTGYLYSYPFLSPTPLAGAPIITTSARTRNVYQHIFYAADSTLAFVALPQNIVPFPIAEAQAAVMAGVWAGRVGIPGREEMESWERGVVEKKGDGKEFHFLALPEDGLYLNMLHDWAVGGSVDGAEEVDGNDDKANGHGRNGVVHNRTTVGKEPPYWDEKTLWIRERCGDIKETFRNLGEKRHQVRTLEEIGYDFEEWKRIHGEDNKYARMANMGKARNGHF